MFYHRSVNDDRSARLVSCDSRSSPACFGEVVAVPNPREGRVEGGVVAHNDRRRPLNTVGVRQQNAPLCFLRRRLCIFPYVQQECLIS